MNSQNSFDTHDYLWKNLENGVDRIMNDLEKGLSFDSYMELYTAIHNYCIDSKLIHGSISSDIRQNRGTHLMGGFLYEQLSDYLKRHLSSVQSQCETLSADPLLDFYAKQWKRYTSASTFIHHVFGYLNRHWVRREIDEGRKNVYDVYTLCLVSWRDHLFMHIYPQLVQASLKLIERHRNGEGIDTALLKTITGSFALLGLNDANASYGVSGDSLSPGGINGTIQSLNTTHSLSNSVPSDSTFLVSRKTLEIYKKYFEEPFIRETKQFYKTESEQFLSSNPIVDYLAKAEARFREEEDRVNLYLDASTMKPLISVCEKQLVDAHKICLIEEFKSLLVNDKLEDLSRMYYLLSKIPGGLDPLKQIFEEHVKQNGLEAIEKAIKSTSSQPKQARPSQDIDPKVYTDTLLGVHRIFLHVVQTSFHEDPGFIGSLDKACRDFVNRNAICKNFSKSPEYLAKYADILLKKSARTEESAVESGLNDIMIIFKYIEDKDVFQKFFSKMLAKRLVYDTSVSDDAEAGMISRLKDACGFEYTSKLQRMFTDMSLSKDNNDSFKQAYASIDMSSSGKFDFYVKVLATGAWPLQPPTSTFTVPYQLESYREAFENHYLEKHSGRKLTWLYHLSTGELKTNYLKAGLGGHGAGYIFMLYTYAMSVLLAFNDAVLKDEKITLTVGELREKTDLNASTLEGVLAGLLKAKVLLIVKNTVDNNSSSDSLDEDSKILGSQDTIIELNQNFKSKKIRVNLKMSLRSEQKAENDETHKHVEEDRKLLIQAAIVRIMKTRKTLKHVALVQEVISQLQSRFKPRIPDIKKSVDILLEKEYLERVDGQKDTYNYLA